ncbi:MAG TPA: hypothetical protein VMX97_18060, partial [Hyphomicrobiaceae bacterium]|nr:hypothetical protein [Hyphomicrobiaceae bacterium]
VMSATNKPQGSLHMRTDADSPPELYHNSEVRKLGFAGQAIECRLGTLVANQANVYETYLPCNAIITGVSRRFTLKPASAGGTVVTGITLDGNQILASASEDEEGITNDTLTAHNLTGTSAHLKAAVGKKVVVTVTSDNADMTDGTGCQFFLYYDQN